MITLLRFRKLVGITGSGPFRSYLGVVIVIRRNPVSLCVIMFGSNLTLLLTVMLKFLFTKLIWWTLRR